MRAARGLLLVAVWLLGAWLFYGLDDWKYEAGRRLRRPTRRT